MRISDAMKTSGFKWASKKARWFFAPGNPSRRRWSYRNMAEIRAKYGSQKVKVDEPLFLH